MMHALISYVSDYMLYRVVYLVLRAAHTDKHKIQRKVPQHVLSLSLSLYDHCERLLQWIQNNMQEERSENRAYLQVSFCVFMFKSTLEKLKRDLIAS
jgi:hypothetical protein